ncbi:hypothetical protein DID88_001665 [Monilinia fructigena]|uniref:O-methyltransferase C-terminal domain-containing protein n=1 Tax=Monilinia fructigena TaxID=38457 RepID=A0A395IWK1_9HELO|nr:hypothetical protein DID88_001665 [Monilinia fructigena]
MNHTFTARFFHVQQVKNAKFYYMSNILHDWPWPDDKCKIILTHLREAMGPDSAILIDEMVLPSTGTSSQAMSIDFTMMAALSAMGTYSEPMGEVIVFEFCMFKGGKKFTLIPSP